jgi:hypothetical protein
MSEGANNTISLSSDTEDEESVGELEINYWNDGVVTFSTDNVAMLDQSQVNTLFDFIARQRENFNHGENYRIHP